MAHLAEQQRELAGAGADVCDAQDGRFVAARTSDRPASASVHAPRYATLPCAMSPQLS
jgi:hypothetical protein